MSAVPAAATKEAKSHTSDTIDSRNPEATAPEDLVQYLVLRKDLWTSLNWPLGSIVAQACHASTAALWLSKDSIATNAYCAGHNLEHMHKVSP